MHSAAFRPASPASKPLHELAVWARWCPCEIPPVPRQCITTIYPSADLSGVPAPGVSSSQAIRILESLARELLPPGMAIEWTELTLLEILAGRSGAWIFGLCVLMVFLVLAAQYESWLLPLAIILITPLSLLFAILAVWARGLDNNLYVQIGLVVLIGLACKNAVLIVEFARQLQEKGLDRFDAVREAARLRLRPILMTSLAFTFGELPPMIATGAGSQLRRAIGTATFWGMLGVTAFGIFLTPVFYVVLRRLAGVKSRPHPPQVRGNEAGAAAVAGLILACAGVLGLSGCTVGPDYQTPPARVTAAFVQGTSPHFAPAPPEIEWWQNFHDPLLDRLITQAVAGNQDLRMATARLREARALRRATALDQFPTLQGSGGYNRSVRSADAMPGVPRNRRELDLYDAGFDAFWELDLWGRVRRTVEAADAEAAAVEARRREVAVILLAEVARNYCELRGLQQQLAVTRENAQLQRESLEILEAKLRAGRGTELDVARARAQYEATLSQIPTLEASVQRTVHRLSALTGQQPVALESELFVSGPIPVPPPWVNIGNPADLLRRRPDIQAAERTLAAATARIGVAIADLFPRVTFLGSLGWQAGELSGLASAASDTYSLGPRITWAALDLSRVRARLEAARARAEAQLAFYEKTVLEALEETEGALVELGRARARREHLRAATDSARQAAQLAEQRYQAGVTEYLSVLDAQRTQLTLQDQLAQAETRLATAYVALYKALGGGWEWEALPSDFPGTASSKRPSP